MGDHVTTVEYLLPRLNVICVDDALLYAIEDDHVKVSDYYTRSNVLNLCIGLAVCYNGGLSIVSQVFESS